MWGAITKSRRDSEEEWGAVVFRVFIHVKNKINNLFYISLIMQISVLSRFTGAFYVVQAQASKTRFTTKLIPCTFVIFWYCNPPNRPKTIKGSFLFLTAICPHESLPMTWDSCGETSYVVRRHHTTLAHGGRVDSMEEHERQKVGWGRYGYLKVIG